MELRFAFAAVYVALSILFLVGLARAAMRKQMLWAIGWLVLLAISIFGNLANFDPTTVANNIRLDLLLVNYLLLPVLAIIGIVAFVFAWKSDHANKAS